MEEGVTLPKAKQPMRVLATERWSSCLIHQCAYIIGTGRLFGFETLYATDRRQLGRFGGIALCKEVLGIDALRSGDDRAPACGLYKCWYIDALGQQVQRGEAWPNAAMSAIPRFIES